MRKIIGNYSVKTSNKTSFISKISDIYTFDEEKNKGLRGKEEVLSTPDSKVKVFVIPTNEELAICQETAELVKNQK